MQFNGGVDGDRCPQNIEGYAKVNWSAWRLDRGRDGADKFSFELFDVRNERVIPSAVLIHGHSVNAGTC